MIRIAVMLHFMVGLLRPFRGPARTVRVLDPDERPDGSLADFRALPGRSGSWISLFFPEIMAEAERRAQRQHREQEFEEAFHRNLPFLILIKMRENVNRLQFESAPCCACSARPRAYIEKPMTNALPAAVLLALLLPAARRRPIRPPGGLRRRVLSGRPGRSGRRDRRLLAAAAAAPAIAPAGRIVGLIAPHAGYVYSGRTAAAAYAFVRGRKIDTVVIVGPSHRVAFEGAAIWPRGGFGTPLGVARVDADLAKAIAKASGARFLPEAFAEEHSVEVQVPFVQRALPEAAIVPIVMGRPDPGRHPAAGCGPGRDVPRQERPRRRFDRPVPLPAQSPGPGHGRGNGRPHPRPEDGRPHPQGRGRARTIMCGGGPVAALLLLAEKAGTAQGRDPRPDRLVLLRRSRRRVSRRGRPRRKRIRRRRIFR
ncbi:MAG: AmmeMemoRadiSam system protein B [Anaerotruncus sp.]|nr:AmmeMemoRadiSam system protein B [Anaerotruncus sp.]